MRILPIFISHFGCPFKCIYCNQFDITKSRGINFNNITSQIKKFSRYQTSYDEIAFYGGTFTGLDIELQKKLLEIANTYAPQVPIRISTRPDFIDEGILDFLYKYNVRTIELGIQSFSDSVLLASKRGYDSQTAIHSCDMIKKSPLKLSVQLMPGLPSFSYDSLKITEKTTIQILPDYVRIYPTVVLKNTKLEKLYLDGSYQPLTIQEAIDIVSELIISFEKVGIKIIKTGLHSDISEIVAGPYHESFGELVRQETLFKNIRLNYKKNSTIVISMKDISLFKGYKGIMIKKLKSFAKVDKLPISIDKNLSKNQFYFSDKIKPDYIW